MIRSILAVVIALGIFAGVTQAQPIPGRQGTGGDTPADPCGSSGDLQYNNAGACGGYSIGTGLSVIGGALTATAGCPSGIETWDGTADKTIAGTTGLLYTTGATPIAAARVLSLPTVASFGVAANCAVRVIDLAGIFNSSNLVTPTRQSSDTIDGGTTGTTLGGAHQSVSYVAAETGKWATYVPPSIPSDSAVANQFVTAIPSTGIITRAQPSFSNISGTAGVSQGGTGLTSGTSGGVLAYTASGTLASSGALTANLPVIGGGAGAAPTVGTRSGNTTAYVTTTGAQTSGDCVKIDANGNHIANGSACGGSGKTLIMFTTSDTANLGTGATNYFGYRVATTEATPNYIPVRVFAGTIGRLSCDASAALGAGSYTLTVRKNGTTDTAVTCTITNPAQSCADDSNTASVSLNDKLYIKSVPASTPTAVKMGCTLELQ